MKYLYIIATQAYYILIRIFSLWNEKANKWYWGRKHILQQIKQSLQNHHQPIIWVHAASAGELEQALPLIQVLKKDFPQYSILLTVFSPSGYKKIVEADFVFYLPKDTPYYAKHFVDIVNPQLVFFIKYEFWYFFIQTIKQKKIPLFLVSGIFRKEQLFFKWYGVFFREMLFAFTHFFVQNEESKKLLENIGLNNTEVCGDTRFDRVNQILQQKKKDFYNIENLFHGRKVWVAGSTWEKDHQLLAQLVEAQPELFFIIVPHEVDESHIRNTLSYFKNAVRYTQIEEKNIPEKTQVLVVDKVGILSQLYRLATITYIGGGFTHSGIHNVLEAAIYGKPVLWGKNYKKYMEAKNLIAYGGGFSIQSAQELKTIVNQLLSDDIYYKKVSQKAYDFVQQYIGATEHIIHYLEKNHFITHS